MDKFIAKKYQTLKCGDIFEIYFKFLEALQEFRGTSTGFTGLSELLIFRFLYHQLGGSFKTHDRTSDSKEFISESHTNFKIGQGISVNVDKRVIRPDISIFHAEDLIAVAPIKVYLTKGIKEIDREMEILEELKTRYPKLQALLIIFRGPSEKGETFRELAKQKNIKEWFNFLILEANKESLMKKLHQGLDLARITVASLN